MTTGFFAEEVSTVDTAKKPHSENTTCEEQHMLTVWDYYERDKLMAYIFSLEQETPLKQYGSKRC